jgi:hypothetical protein
MSPGPRRLYAPAPVKIETGSGGMPARVAGVGVEVVREEWVVDERWWIPERLQRHYFELALAGGRSAVVFRCALSGRWYRQRA